MQLDAAMLREFIDRIEVSIPTKIQDKEITIVYNFIGAFDFERAKRKPKYNGRNSKERHSRLATPFLAKMFFLIHRPIGVFNKVILT